MCHRQIPSIQEEKIYIAKEKEILLDFQFIPCYWDNMKKSNLEKKLFEILTCLNKKCYFPKFMWTNKVRGTIKDRKNLNRVHKILYERYNWF